jgi:hypothetical protein
MSFSFILLSNSKDRQPGLMSHPWVQAYLMAWAGCSVRSELEAHLPNVPGVGGTKEVISAYCSTAQVPV